MGTAQILTLVGGLALFLYGMYMMSRGLERTAGDKLKGILERLTKKPLLGVLTGALITATIQSSSATTVMVVGFVNAKLMSIFNAVWVIMGANIGTTITGQLVALNIGKIAPLFALIGVVCIVFYKKKKIVYSGEIVAGLGILFIGMNLMSEAMMPLRSNTEFIGLMTRFQNPLLGILIGAIFTAIIQSSSASLGILQALAMSGAIGLESSAFILFGQNIGTCVTAVIASASASRNAKRTALIHLFFNVFGTIFFTLICILLPVTDWIKALTPTNPMAQIANIHTVFNIVTTAILFPFGRKLANLSIRILPDDVKGSAEKMSYGSLSIGTSAIAIAELNGELNKMYNLAAKNTKAAFEQILKFDKEKQKTIELREDDIDIFNAKIAQEIVKISTQEISFRERDMLVSYLKIISNVERIADHALNLSEYGETIKNEAMVLGAEKDEITALYEIIENSMENINNLQTVGYNEKQIDALRLYYREAQFERIKNKNCAAKLSVIYDEILTDIERISDHLLNIAEVKNIEIEVNV